MPSAAVEAQFKAVVDATWKALKPLGFSRRGSKFRRPSGANIALVQFQRSKWNDATEIRFTLNVSIVSARLAKEEWDMGDLSRASEWHGHFRKRIGSFQETPLDVWWALGEETDFGQAVDEITGLLTSKAMPFLDGCQSDSDLLRLWKSGRSDGITKFQRDRWVAILEGPSI